MINLILKAYVGNKWGWSFDRGKIDCLQLDCKTIFSSKTTQF